MDVSDGLAALPIPSEPFRKSGAGGNGDTRCHAVRRELWSAGGPAWSAPGARGGAFRRRVRLDERGRGGQGCYGLAEKPLSAAEFCKLRTRPVKPKRRGASKGRGGAVRGHQRLTRVRRGLRFRGPRAA